MSRRQYLVTAALIRRDDHILLVQQQGPADPAPTWALPGGVVEEGELLTEALIREIREETGLVITEVGPLAYVTQLDHARNETHSLAFVFEVIAWSGRIQSNDPDNVIVGAEFWSISDTIIKAQMLPWPMMREPFIAYVQGTVPRGSVWLYRDECTQGQQLFAKIGGSHSAPE